MEQQVIDEIIEIMPKGKTGFHYFKDRYALMLLADVVNDGVKMADLRHSPWAKLLQKPLVKQICAANGNGVLKQSDFDYLWPDATKQFLLTLSRWGGQKPSWQQTSRKGYNLVLQLNFSNQHQLYFEQLLKPAKYHRLRSCGHPIMQPDRRELFRETLAWARIDLDLNTNEALIEEIQNDWLRNALRWRQIILRRHNNQRQPCEDLSLKADVDSVMQYCDEVLAPYRKMWDEAMLAATIDFIYRQLGISTIYYHSYESGAWLKAINGAKPPRSLYTELPKRFCFTRTEREPEFLTKERYFKYRKRKGKHLDFYWYTMNLA